jgi:hypothetical protein
VVLVVAVLMVPHLTVAAAQLGRAIMVAPVRLVQQAVVAARAVLARLGALAQLAQPVALAQILQSLARRRRAPMSRVTIKSVVAEAVQGVLRVARQRLVAALAQRQRMLVTH